MKDSAVARNLAEHEQTNKISFKTDKMSSKKFFIYDFKLRKLIHCKNGHGVVTNEETLGSSDLVLTLIFFMISIRKFNFILRETF